MSKFTCNIDQEGLRIVDADRTFQEFVGKEKEELKGRGFRTLLRDAGIHGGLPDQPRDGEVYLLCSENADEPFILNVTQDEGKGEFHLNFHPLGGLSAEEVYHQELFYEVSRDLLGVGDLKNSRFLKVNPSFYRILGYTEEEVLEMEFFEFCHPDDWEPLKKELGNFAKGRPVEGFRARGVRKDGRTLWIEWSGYPETHTGLFYVIGRDVDEEVRAFRELKGRQDWFHNLFDEAPVAKVIYDGKKYIDVNKVCLDLLGERKEDMIGERPLDLFKVKNIKSFNRKVKEVIEGGGSFYSFPVSGRRRDGKHLELEVDGNRVMYEGDPCVHLVVRDVKERKRFEREIERLALIARETDNAVLVTDAEGLTEWVNAGFARISGFELHEIQGKKPGDLLQGEGSDPEEIEKMRAAIREKRKVEAELINYTKEGAPYWVRIYLQPIFNSSGELTSFFSIQTDMTERRMMEERVRENERKFHYLLQNMNEGILELDENFNVSFINDFLLRRLGMPREKVIGKNLIQFMKGYGPEVVPKVEEAYQNRKKGFAGQGEYSLKSEEGEEIPFLVTGNPVIDEAGNFKGDVVIFADLSERKASERRVLNAVIQTQESERKRFAEDLHDGIGQLLSATRMQLNRLEEDPDPGAIREVRKMIEEAIGETRNITYGLMPNELRDFGFFKAIDNLLDRTEKTGKLKIFSSFPEPQEVPAFEEELQVALYRIFQEILHNVMKHSGADRLNVQVEYDEKEKELRFSVLDNGRGFDPEEDKDRRGLTNIKHRADLFGGKVSVNTEPGKGTRIEGSVRITSRS